MRNQNIDDFIAVFPEKTRNILIKLRSVIAHAASDADEAIVYGIPTFRLCGRNLVHYSAFARHIGFYPTPSGIEKFKKELSPYETTRGSIRFTLEKPIPYGLIRKIVAFRVKEIRRRAP